MFLESKIIALSTEFLFFSAFESINNFFFFIIHNNYNYNYNNNLLLQSKNIRRKEIICLYFNNK